MKYLKNLMSSSSFLMQALIILCLFLVVSCTKDSDTSTPNTPNDQDRGVVMNGVKWATRNVGAPGTFVSSPREYGEHYTWEEAQNVCPCGWRLPTLKETESLAFTDGEWTTRYSINGRVFGNGYNTMFLPASGSRSNIDGIVYKRDSIGLYWCSNFNPDYAGAWYMYFTNNSMGGGGITSSDSYSVRCVEE